MSSAPGHTRGMPKGGRSILTTLLFTDIVGSTRLAEEMGDRRWRELLARHHRLIRSELKRHEGRELDTAGDGFFARFDTPASAIRCACAAGDAVRTLGIEVRAGVHIGECEILDGKVSGVNVHICARTMAEARGGQVLVTGGVRDMVKGAGFGFADRGMHELKGVEGEWHLFDVTSVDDSPRPPAAPDEEARARRDTIEPPPLVKRKWVRVAAMTTAIAVIIAGAAMVFARTVGRPPKAAVTGCEVAAGPPLNDHAFNQAVFDGLTDAATAWGVSVRDKVAESYSTDAWKKAIREVSNQHCSMIVTIGDQMGQVALPIAKDHPTQRFVVTDPLGNPSTLPNVLSVQFRPDQAAFEAGYLAAGMTKTGTVATFGAIPIKVVTPYMTGFAAGVLYYNRLNGTRVQLLGWNPKTQTGTFVSDDPTDFNVFGDTASARHITADFIAKGADIVMPVDGTVGNQGAGEGAQRATNVLLIGVDTDQHFSTPEFETLWLTSVLKNYRVMVRDAMGEIVHGDFKGGVLTATVGNDGVALAPFYHFSKLVPAALQSKLKEIKAGIANGSISVDPASYLES